MNGRNMGLVGQVLDIVAEYYRQQLGQIPSVSMKPVCFCAHNPECEIGDHGPMAVPDVEAGRLQVHINSVISPDWYPNQLLYQYAHELWHVYEFSWYGIDYPWQRFEGDIEPYAYAASLCVLLQRMIPSHILADTSQRAYFETTVSSGPERPVYLPGAKLAEEAGYSLQKLYEQYGRTVSPQILGSPR